MQLTNEDNMQLMARYPDGYFDLAIVDPQYGINAPIMRMGHSPNRKGAGQYPAESTAVKLRESRLQRLNKIEIDWDNEPPPPEYFKELFRVSKNQIIWGGNYFDLPPTRCIICWDKMQPWESFSQWEMAWTSFDKPAAIIRLSNTGGANTEPKIHPTQKPVPLYKWQLRKYAKPGYKILDTNLGSNSIAIACYDLGFDLTGCEIAPETFNTAMDRLNKHVLEYSPAAQHPANAEGQLKLI